MGGGEHAEVALKAMLHLPPDERVPRRALFNGLAAFTEEQLQRAVDGGAAPEVFEFLKTRNPDPRLYAIQNYGWIRVAKSALNLWDWMRALETLRRSSYWAQQESMTPQDMFDVIEFSTNRKFSITVEKLLGGVDIGEAAIEPEAKKAFVAPRRGMHTSGPGAASWQYRTVGDNPERYGPGGIKAILWCDGNWQEWTVGKSQRPEHADAASTCFGWRVRVTVNEDGSYVGVELMREGGEPNWRELVANEILSRFPRAETITVEDNAGQVLFDGPVHDVAGRGVGSNRRGGP